MSRARSWLLGGFFVLAIVPARVSAAPTAAQVQAARELFQAAEEDEDAKRWADALEKLRRVAAVKLTPGVRYHIALCEEALGQLVAALADYTVAENQARAENAPDVLKLVGEKLKSLRARVPRLTIVVPADIADAEVRLDGEPILKAMWGVQIPLDPGEHKIEAKAPGRVAMARTLKMDERDTTLVEVKLPEAPKTQPAPATSSTPGVGSARAPAPTTAPIATTSRPEPAEKPPTESHTGAIVATLGAAALAGGGVFAYVFAGKTHDDNVVACSAQTSPCDDLKHQVQLWDTLALSAWIGAAALTTVAVVLWTSSPAPSRTPTKGELYVLPGTLGVKGSF
jgi:hypothetical protein